VHADTSHVSPITPRKPARPAPRAFLGYSPLPLVRSPTQVNEAQPGRASPELKPSSQPACRQSAQKQHATSPAHSKASLTMTNKARPSIKQPCGVLDRTRSNSAWPAPVASKHVQKRACTGWPASAESVPSKPAVKGWPPSVAFSGHSESQSPSAPRYASGSLRAPGVRHTKSCDEVVIVHEHLVDDMDQPNKPAPVADTSRGICMGSEPSLAVATATSAHGPASAAAQGLHSSTAMLSDPVAAKSAPPVSNYAQGAPGTKVGRSPAVATETLPPELPSEFTLSTSVCTMRPTSSVTKAATVHDAVHASEPCVMLAPAVPGIAAAPADTAMTLGAMPHGCGVEENGAGGVTTAQAGAAVQHWLAVPEHDVVKCDSLPDCTRQFGKRNVPPPPTCIAAKEDGNVLESRCAMAADKQDCIGHVEGADAAWQAMHAGAAALQSETARKSTTVHVRDLMDPSSCSAMPRSCSMDPAPEYLAPLHANPSGRKAPVPDGGHAARGSAVNGQHINESASEPCNMRKAPHCDKQSNGGSIQSGWKHPNDAKADAMSLERTSILERLASVQLQIARRKLAKGVWWQPRRVALVPELLEALHSQDQVKSLELRAYYLRFQFQCS
jgi:hypothetical protein